MIVIGVDVHKHSLTAVAVDETGRLLAERTLQGGEDGLVAWACELDSERLWAVEDCRHVTGALERELVAAGERLLRVPPKLTAPERRGGPAGHAGSQTRSTRSPLPERHCASRVSTDPGPAKSACAR
jgi:transposase